MNREILPEVPLPMPNESKEQHEKRIQTLKDLIDAGQFHVNSASLADAILERGRRRISNRTDSLAKRREYMRNYMREKRLKRNFLIIPDSD